MIWRVLGVVVVLAGLGIGAGFALGTVMADSPATAGVPAPVPASSPSAPVEPARPYAPDVDYPPLATDLAYDPQSVGQGAFTWGYGAPRGWVPTTVGPLEVTWGPTTAPPGTYGMRVKVVNERKTPAAMVEQKIMDLADAVDDVIVLGKTTDSLAITYRTGGDRLRYNTFRWFTQSGESAAEFEVSVSGRARDLDGLGDLLDQIAASVRFDPPAPADSADSAGSAGSADSSAPASPSTP